MGRMIRKQIVIDAEREALTARLAAERGISQSELIRIAIDEFARSVREHDARAAAHAELLVLFGAAPDVGLATGSGRSWTREELHERGTR